ncbi:MAG: pyridoxal-phosphate dependent enzyme, partial [Deltaproteobacteria bacterium]
LRHPHRAWDHRRNRWGMIMEDAVEKARYPLEEAFPGLAALPRFPLGRWPTPVQRLAAFGKAVGASNLWMKRDDLSAERYGGNKVRKLEFLFGAWRAAGIRQIVTGGGIGSHLVLALALYAPLFGMRVVSCHFDQPITPHVQETLRLVQEAGVEMHRSRTMAGFLFDLYATWVGKRRRDPRTRLLFPGGSTPLSSLGYVNAAFELAAQIAAGELPEPVEIYVAVGSCGTIAGLLAGSRLAGIRSRIVGVRVVDRIVVNRFRIARMANRTLRLLARFVPDLPRIRFSPWEIHLREDAFGRGYGHPTPEGLAAIATMAEREGIPLEPTYTGKTLAACLTALREDPSRPTLFWNTFNSRPLPPPDPPLSPHSPPIARTRSKKT